jgi:hypothetical protein
VTKKFKKAVEDELWWRIKGEAFIERIVVEPDFLKAEEETSRENGRVRGFL